MHAARQRCHACSWAALPCIQLIAFYAGGPRCSTCSWAALPCMQLGRIAMHAVGQRCHEHACRWAALPYIHANGQHCHAALPHQGLGQQRPAHEASNTNVQIWHAGTNGMHMARALHASWSCADTHLLGSSCHTRVAAALASICCLQAKGVANQPTQQQALQQNHMHMCTYCQHMHHMPSGIC